MRINKTLAIRAIARLIKDSFVLNRDPAARSDARCQVWTESGGNYRILAMGRTWEAVISTIRKQVTAQ